MDKHSVSFNSDRKSRDTRMDIHAKKLSEEMARSRGGPFQLHVISESREPLSIPNATHRKKP